MCLIICLKQINQPLKQNGYEIEQPSYDDIMDYNYKV